MLFAWPCCIRSFCRTDDAVGNCAGLVGCMFASSLQTVSPNTLATGWQMCAAGRLDGRGAFAGGSASTLRGAEREKPPQIKIIARILSDFMLFPLVGANHDG